MSDFERSCVRFWMAKANSISKVYSGATEVPQTVWDLFFDWRDQFMKISAKLRDEIWAWASTQPGFSGEGKGARFREVTKLLYDNKSTTKYASKLALTQNFEGLDAAISELNQLVSKGKIPEEYRIGSDVQED